MSGIPFVGICSGGPLNGQKMAREESLMEVFGLNTGGLSDDDYLPDWPVGDVAVTGRYEYNGYGLWSWQPTETK